MKLWRLLMVAMAALVCFACSEDTTESEPLQVLELTGEIMPIDEDAESRAQAYDNSAQGVGIYWLPSDHIGVFTSRGTENADFRSTTYSKTNKATFRGSISGTPKYAYFPYSAEAGNDMTAVKATFEPYQYYSTKDKELTNDFKIGVYERRLLYINYFTFTHIFSFFRVKVDPSGTAMVGEQLEKVILTFPEGVLPSGDFTMNLPAGSFTWSGNNYEKNQLVLEFTDKPTLEEDVVIQGYLTVPPMSNSKGAVVGVSVRSTNKEAVYNGGRLLNANVAGNKTYNYTLTLNDGNYTIADRPAINGLSFTAADNEGKILASKLSYSKSTSSGWISKTEIGVTANTSASATTQVMTIDDEKNTITGCIPYLFDRNLVPTFSNPESCTISYSYDGGESFTEWVSGDPIDFSAGTVIRVDNGSVSRDYKVNITNTGLPVVVVDQPDGDTDWSYSSGGGIFSSSSISVKTGLKVWSKATDFDTIMAAEGTVTVYNADGSINVPSALAATRLRGNTTQAFPKKPFAIKFDKKQSVLGMPKHKRWVLLANMKDMSLMRNHIAFGVANTFAEVMPDGIPWHPHGEFVELVYNGVHVGHYYLCEQIKIDENRVNVQDEYDSEKYPTITQDQVDNFGYLIECDDYYDENTKFLTRHYIPFQFKDDGDAGNVILNYVQTKVQAIEDNLYAGFKNQNLDSYKAAYANMHVPSFVDQLLIYEMTMNSEFGHPRSMYMVMNGKSALACGPVWDFDWLSFPLDNDTQKSLESTWDRDLTKSLMTTPSHINKHYVSSTVPTSAVTGDVPYHWYPMLITEENFQDLAAERWARIKPYLATYANEILVQGERLKLSWEYNNAIWPAYDCETWRKSWCDGGFCGDELFTTYEEVYQGMYEAYMKRLSGMDFVTNKNWPTWTITEK